MKTIKLQELWEFTYKALVHTGVCDADATTIADTLVTTDSFGVLSHGTKNLYQYILKCREGGLDPKAVPTVVNEGPAWAIIDGNCAFGMVTACKGMNLAIEKARKCGIGYVGVRNSCHFGAAGYYANLAAKAGMIGLSMSNADPNMAIPNSSDVAIGNNPFSFAAPLSNGKSVFLDIALSGVAALKVVMAKEKGERVPSSWLIDEDGRPTDDPSGFPEHSHLQPMAAHKGYGLAIMVETLASAITCSGMLHQVQSWNLDMASKNNVGHAFIAVNAGAMMDPALFLERMDAMVAELKASPKAKGAEQIFVPGEMEWAKREVVLERGEIALTDAMVDNMEKLSALTGVEIDWN